MRKLALNGLNLWIAPVAISLGLLSSCTESSETSSPPSAKQILANDDDLMRLFERECVKQLDLDWVRSEVQRRYDRCRSFKTGQQGDCEQDVAFYIKWDSPTKWHSPVMATMSASNREADLRTAPGRQFCEMDVPNDFDGMSAVPVDRLIAAKWPSQIPTYQVVGASQVWTWKIEDTEGHHTKVVATHFTSENILYSWQILYSPR